MPLKAVGGYMGPKATPGPTSPAGGRGPCLFTTFGPHPACLVPSKMHSLPAGHPEASARSLSTLRENQTSQHFSMITIGGGVHSVPHSL